MWYMPDEDAYYEHRREELEMIPDDWEPEPEWHILSLDEEIADLENEYGCKLEDLNEADLEDIAYRIKGVNPLYAEYDPALLAIVYTA